MSECCDLMFLSALACQLGKCLSEEELELLAPNLVALGDLLAVLIAKRGICSEKKESCTPPPQEECMKQEPLED